MDEQFYASLPEIEDFADVVDRSRYTDVPESWLLVLTDVKGSTKAIEAGRYRDVNAVGVASIVALRNALSDLEIPYVFGGDGATLLIPGTRSEAARAALRGARKLAAEAFGLELRAGIVPIRELHQEQLPVRVARFRASAGIRLAMLSGAGLAAAERRVKDPDRTAAYEVSADGDETVCFDGFECRWEPVKSRRGVVVSLLVVSLAEGDSSERTYREVIQTVERIAQADPHPITPDGLHLMGLRGDFQVEANVRSRGISGVSQSAAHRNARNMSMIGSVLMGLRASAGGFEGGAYRRELVENTDFRKFDETLRMVLDLSNDEVTALRAGLTREHQAGKLAFGIHCSPAALVTCFIRSYSGDHVHFVDGSDGGYALAAKELKAQLKAR